MLEKLVLFYQFNNTDAIDVKMDMSLLKEKSCFKMLGLTFSCELDQVLTLFLLLNLSSRKLEPWFVLWSFFLLRLICISKTTIQLFTEYSCHIWAGAPSCDLELLDKLQKQICWTVGPSLAASLEPLAHHRIAASLSLFYRYYFGRCSSELAQLVPLP